MDLALRIQSNKMGNSQPSGEDIYHLIWRVLARAEVCTGGGALGRAGCWKVEAGVTRRKLGIEE